MHRRPKFYAPGRCTPSQLKAWIDAGLLEDPTLALRRVLVGGEAIEPQLWERLSRCSRISFINVYGPTECTVDVTAARVCNDGFGPHIGHPMQNRRVYILDGREEPLPVGVVGEIFVGGAGLARGYWGRPGLTDERFLRDPFRSEPGARMYRTGDLGRWRPDGTIEYVGRNDHQVKIRGFRIELGEIEQQLARHPAVREAAVVVREDAPGAKRLVAYVCPHPGVPCAEDRLRPYLKELLPEYMLPSLYVVLEEFPRTASGKLARRLLPEPEIAACAGYDPPRGEAEERLAAIWRAILGVERIGREDDFFELGGHSLNILNMLEMIRKSFGARLSVPHVLRNPTLQALARQAAAAAPNHSDVEAAPSEPDLEEGVL